MKSGRLISKTLMNFNFLKLVMSATSFGNYGEKFTKEKIFPGSKIFFPGKLFVISPCNARNVKFVKFVKFLRLLKFIPSSVIVNFTKFVIGEKFEDSLASRDSGDFRISQPPHSPIWNIKEIPYLVTRFLEVLLHFSIF